MRPIFEPKLSAAISISSIAIAHAESFRLCLDTVARERKYLAMTEAPPLAQVRGFIADNIAGKVPQVVALDAGRVVGWCDILPKWQQALRHSGSLGMGLLPEYRGLGLGKQLLKACLSRARAAGLTRVELEVRVENQSAFRLYEQLGFVREGLKRKGSRVDGQYYDTISMALLFE